ncbi:MAG: hypothetical protein HN882_00275, partial [Planctomycetaceae bacterium]|nr:hypothetical protein [Planctomycetaceae bacterium]
MKRNPTVHFPHTAKIAVVVFLLLAVHSAAIGQNSLSVSKPEADNSVAAELKSFTLAA